MRQWPFVLEHLAEITAIDPAVAGGAPDEVLGLVVWEIAKRLTDVLPARELCRRLGDEV
jgi:hypothetical protein